MRKLITVYTSICLNHGWSIPNCAASHTHICTQIILTALKQNSYLLLACVCWHSWRVYFLFSLSFFSSLICFRSLSDSITHPPPLSFYLSHSHSLLLPLSRSCLFHRALQHLRINKLYISLCTHSKAPFRKGTKLICPRASVYPKWLHQTWSWVSGSPDCPCSFVMYQT